MKLDIMIFRSTLFCLSFVSLLGCRRTLYDNTEEGKAPVELVFDWAQSDLIVSNLNRASAQIFPESGAAPIEVVLTENLTKTTVWLAPGSYRAVGINRTVASTDWQGIDFSGLDRLDTFSASMRLLSGKAAEAQVGLGNHLAVANSGLFQVTESMVGQTVDQKPLTVTFTPKAVTQRIRVVARIANLDNARALSATLSGMYANCLLGSSVYSDQRATHHFTFTERIYDPANTHNGTAQVEFDVFKLGQADDFAKKLSLTALLLDNTPYTQDFEVTRRIDDLGGVRYEINIGAGAQEPITLPERPRPPVVGEPGVGDWPEDTNHPLK